MGYTTEFKGDFSVTGEITPEFVRYIQRFAETRHIKYDTKKIKSTIRDWPAYAFKGNLGRYGEFYVSDLPYDTREGIVSDINVTPNGVPSIWCQWVFQDSSGENIPSSETDEVISEKIAEGIRFGWDGNEKFYSYEEWLVYLIKNFFEPSEVILNGAVITYGESEGDSEYIVVKNNEVAIFPALDYSRNAFDSIADFASKEIAESVYVSPEEIEEYWDYDDE